jgi:hypothetical protein
MPSTISSSSLEKELPCCFASSGNCFTWSTHSLRVQETSIPAISLPNITRSIPTRSRSQSSRLQISSGLAQCCQRLISRYTFVLKIATLNASSLQVSQRAECPRTKWTSGLGRASVALSDEPFSTAVSVAQPPGIASLGAELSRGSPSPQLSLARSRLWRPLLLRRGLDAFDARAITKLGGHGLLSTPDLPPGSPLSLQESQGVAPHPTLSPTVRRPRPSRIPAACPRRAPGRSQGWPPRPTLSATVRRPRPSRTPAACSRRAPGRSYTRVRARGLGRPRLGPVESSRVRGEAPPSEVSIRLHPRTRGCPIPGQQYIGERLPPHSRRGASPRP